MEEESEAATGGDVGAEAGDGVWLSGEVVQLVAGGGFHVRLISDPAAVVDAQPPAAAPLVSEALWQVGEGRSWRRARPSGARAWVRSVHWPIRAGLANSRRI